MTHFTSKPRQSFEIGSIVKIGFVDGLEVVKKVATPGDYRPDFYVLWQAATDRFYAFQAHFGLTRCASYEAAKLAFV